MQAYKQDKKIDDFQHNIILKMVLKRSYKNNKIIILNEFSSQNTKNTMYKNNLSYLLW